MVETNPNPNQSPAGGQSSGMQPRLETHSLTKGLVVTNELAGLEATLDPTEAARHVNGVIKWYPKEESSGSPEGLQALASNTEQDIVKFRDSEGIQASWEAAGSILLRERSMVVGLKTYALVGGLELEPQEDE